MARITQRQSPQGSEGVPSSDRTPLPTSAEMGPAPGPETPGFRGPLGASRGDRRPVFLTVSLPERGRCPTSDCSRLERLTPIRGSSSIPLPTRCRWATWRRSEVCLLPQESSKGGFLPDIEGTAKKSSSDRKVQALQNWAGKRESGSFPDPASGWSPASASIHFPVYPGQAHGRHRASASVLAIRRFSVRPLLPWHF